MQAISFAAPQFDLNQDNPYFAEKKAGWQGMQQVAEHRMAIRDANQKDWQLRLMEQKENNDRWYRQQSLKQADKQMSLSADASRVESTIKMMSLDQERQKLPLLLESARAESIYKQSLAQESLQKMDYLRKGLAERESSGATSGVTNRFLTNYQRPTPEEPKETGKGMFATFGNPLSASEGF